MALLELHHVTKNFKNGLASFCALSDISLQFPRHGLVAIFGASGSGKSTLLHLLSGLDRPSSGKILVDGQDTARWKEKDYVRYRRWHASLIFQRYNLFPFFDGLANVMLPLLMRGEKPNVARRRAEELFAEFGLTGLLKQKAGTLSGGECQRLAIMRALIKSPEIILADEPTGALDEANAGLVLEILRKIADSRLVIVVSHNIELLSGFADRVIVLKEGRVSADSLTSLSENELPKRPEGKHGELTWPILFAKEHFRRLWKRRTVGVLASVIGLVSLLTTIGFYRGADMAVRRETARYLDYQTATISKKSSEDIDDSPLSLTQTVRPSRAEAAQFAAMAPNLRVELDFSSLLLPYPAARYHGQPLASFSWLPIESFSLNEDQRKLIIEGKVPESDTLEEIIINSSLADSLRKISGKERVIGEKIAISVNQSFANPTGQDSPRFVTDYFVFEKEAKISGIVDEFSFMNTPKAYYSHRAAKRYLKENEVTNLSLQSGQEISWYDLVRDASGDDPLSAYGFRLFFADASQAESFYQLLKNLSGGPVSYVLASDSFLIKDTLLSMREALAIGLWFFIAISGVGSIFIVGIIDYSSFVEKKKEVAVLMSLGASRADIRSIFVNESLLTGLLSSVLSLLLGHLFQSAANQLVQGWIGLSGLIAIPYVRFFGIPFALEMLFMAGTLLVSYLATALPLRVFGHVSLVDELRDE